MDTDSMPAESVGEQASSSRRRLRRLLSLAGTIVVFAAWGWFLSNQLNELGTYAWHFSPAWLLISIPLAGLYFVSLGGIWALLLRSMNSQTGAVSILQGARIWQFSMFSRYLPGNIWHILSRALLAEQLNASRSLVVASATIEQILTLIGAFTVAVFALPHLGGMVSGFYDAPVDIIVAATLAIGLLVIHPRILGRLLIVIGKRLRRSDLAWRYTYATMLRLLGLYAAAFIIAGGALVAIVFGLGSTRIGDIPFIVGSAALAWAIGYMSIVTPSGLGVREGILTGLLSTILPIPVAVVASLLFRIVSTIGELLALGILWAAERVSNRRR